MADIARRRSLLDWTRPPAGGKARALSGTANKAPPGREQILTTEEAALRHVAMLVARGAQTPEIFEAAAEHVARIVGRPWVGIMQYDSAESAVVVATSGEHPFPVGSRWPLDGPSTLEAVLRSGRAAAIPDYTGLAGTVAQAARQAGIVGGIGAPIVVDGSTWGLIAVAATQGAPLPPGVETRLSVFTELIAAAISNADARRALAMLADEQAALRRVATLVAAQAASDDIHAAVAEEVALLLAAHRCAVGRYEPDQTLTVTGYWSMDGTDIRVGTKIPLEGDVVTAAIRQSGRPMRLDTFDDLSGPVVDYAREVGPLPPSTVGAPIVVDGQAWGVLFVSSMTGPLPGNAESRVVLFTELVAMAIGNADSRSALRELAEEQAPLRRVAELVSQESSPEKIFAAVTDEACRLLATEAVALIRFDPDGSATLLAQSETPWSWSPVGTRVALDGENVIVAVHRTGRAARVDDWEGATGSLAAMANRVGIRSVVASPIVVEGRTWGAIVAATTRSEPLAGGAEKRIEQFTDLVATAISNAAARAELLQLVEEQAALRRLAVFVAQRPSPQAVFAAVAEAMGGVIGADLSTLIVFSDDAVGTVVASWSREGPHLAVGEELPLNNDNVPGRIFQSGAAARIDGDGEGTSVARTRSLGVRSAIGAPVVVGGKLWGALAVGVRGDDPLPEEAEARLAAFTELVATAISNADAHRDLQRLADEQAALQRVATLVAQQPSPEEIFELVSLEVARVFGFDSDPASPDLAGVVRFEPGPALMAVGVSKLTKAVTLGVRFPTDELYVASHVLRTGRSARIGADDLDSVGGETADWFRQHGLLSQVGSPIVVEGRLWGAMTVNSGNDFPAHTEERLERFTELIATAIANAESHDALARLADEQSALRRVATLVARGIGPEGVFRAVASEVGRLFGADVAAIVRFEEDGTVLVLGDVGGPHVSGKRVSLDEGYVVHRVRETGDSSRFDTDDPSAADMPSLVRTLGIRSSVASPIVVEGALWGAITAASVEDTLPSSAERRLTEFTELVATAVANTHAREEVTALATEQAALRRVATLVAVEASQDEVFTAVAEGVAGVLGEELRLVRFEGDLAVVVAASEGPHMDVLPVGTRLPLGGNNALSQVFRTGEPTRIDDYSKASGPIAEVVQAEGLRSIVATPVVVEGRTWGAMIVGTFGETPVPPGTEHRLGQFAELMATDIANTEARAELVASRARIVAAGDEARRRIERNLHDGTQQRLIALGLDLQRTRAAIPANLSDTHFALARLEQDLEAVLGDLRELSHGLHPPLLSRLGLGPSLQALARRSPIPVQVDVDLTDRPAEPLETAIYYVVSEALTNAIKHSRASEIVVTIRSAPGYLHATIVDDGVGGADPSGGSGLTGLVDRVNALGGVFACESRSSCGTRISVDLPIDPVVS
jgi:GAF domain-containing protein